MSFLVPCNAAASGGGSVTVAGINFGEADATPTSAVAATLCTTLSWASATSLTCGSGPGQGVAQEVSATVVTVVGTVAAAFTFDGNGCYCPSFIGFPFLTVPAAPAVSFSDAHNAGTSSGVSLTVSGLSFGVLDQTSTASAATACATTAWASASSVCCELPHGEAALSIVVAAVSSGTGSRLFSFDGQRSSLAFATGFLTDDFLCSGCQWKLWSRAVCHSQHLQSRSSLLPTPLPAAACCLPSPGSTSHPSTTPRRCRCR